MFKEQSQPQRQQVLQSKWLLKMAEIFKTCGRCAGTGILKKDFTGVERECPTCVGMGIIVEYTISDKLIHTYQIVEATEDAEYTALTDAQKARYQAIISLGLVDFAEGTKVREKLLNMFPVGTTTRVNLLNL